jgi:hypothetical protein
MERPVVPHLRFLLHVQLLSPLRRGPTSPQGPFLHSRNPTGDLAVRVAFSSLKMFPSIPSDVLLILKCSGRLVPGNFITILSCRCCLGPRPLKPLLHSFRRFWVSCPILSWSYLLGSCPLCRATFAQSKEDNTQHSQAVTIKNLI